MWSVHPSPPSQCVLVVGTPHPARNARTFGQYEVRAFVFADREWLRQPQSRGIPCVHPLEPAPLGGGGVDGPVFCVANKTSDRPVPSNKTVGRRTPLEIGWHARRSPAPQTSAALPVALHSCHRRPPDRVRAFSTMQHPDPWEPVLSGPRATPGNRPASATDPVSGFRLRGSRVLQTVNRY